MCYYVVLTGLVYWFKKPNDAGQPSTLTVRAPRLPRYAIESSA